MAQCLLEKQGWLRDRESGIQTPVKSEYSVTGGIGAVLIHGDEQWSAHICENFTLFANSMRFVLAAPIWFELSANNVKKKKRVRQRSWMNTNHVIPMRR